MPSGAVVDEVIRKPSVAVSARAEAVTSEKNKENRKTSGIV